MMLLRRAPTVAGVVLCASLVVVAAQETRLVPGWRRLISDTTAPGTDSGIRDVGSIRSQSATHALLVRMRNERLPYLPGSIIVKFRPGTSTLARTSMLALVNGAPDAAASDANFDIVTIRPEADPEAAARSLSGQADVEYAQARYRVGARFVPNDPLYSRQWNYPLIDMEHAWDINPGAASSIIVAVIDTGVAYRSGIFRYPTIAFDDAGDHFPSLGAVDVPFAAAPELGASDRFVAPRDFIWGDMLPLDLDGHGTHVAGTIGEATNNGVGVAGMAFNVRIMPVKVIDTIWDYIFDSPFIATDDVVARGIRYAVDNGAKVLNLSLGRTGSSALVINDAITYAVSHGAFVAVAGGNDFLVGNPVQRPADIGPDVDGLVTVGAVGRNGLRANYSSTGSYIELVAPGGDQDRDGLTGGILQQTFDFSFTDTYVFGPARYGTPRFDIFAYQYIAGTSMSTPHVAAFAALLMQQGITSPAAIEAIMKRYATDVGATGRDNEYGYGLINPRAALRGMGIAK